MQPLERRDFEEASGPVPIGVPPERPSWLRRLGLLLFVVLSFEVGLFLIVFPWLESWDQNRIASMAPWLRGVWDTGYFRGALTGLGAVNVYVALSEIARFRRTMAANRAAKMKASFL